MNTLVSATAIIRQRGQLTIPGFIREKFPWLHVNNVVALRVTADAKILVEPFQEKKQVDWEKLWVQIERVRSYKGRRGNLSQFIAKDREKH